MFVQYSGTVLKFALIVYALTGAIYCEDEPLVQKLAKELRQTAGNFYINDKVIFGYISVKAKDDYFSPAHFHSMEPIF